MKAIPCIIKFNTRWGYPIEPIECKSINEAMKLAHDYEMAFHLFDMNGKEIKSGWYVKPEYNNGSFFPTRLGIR